MQPIIFFDEIPDGAPTHYLARYGLVTASLTTTVPYDPEAITAAVRDRVKADRWNIVVWQRRGADIVFGVIDLPLPSDESPPVWWLGPKKEPG